jgi:hypothetical protein
LRCRRFGRFGYSFNRPKRPESRKLDSEDAKKLIKKAQKEIAASYVLSHMPVDARLQRGRLYIYGPEGDDEGPWARITPLAGSRDGFLLDAPWRGAWREVAQGSLAKTLRLVAEDDLGTFHGLGAIQKRIRRLRLGAEPRDQVMLEGREFVHADDRSPCTVGEVLHWYFGVPLRVAREPVIWYERHREPSLVEFDLERKRALVRFEQYSLQGGFFGGTCLYAVVNDSWGAYGIKPSESGSIQKAEAWLVKKKWCAWV